ncbi:nucleotide exchange factor GrpE [Lewinellaceae bacterium SD302]|nr:nucleotide exchange factor GrpE [Lewinellaceae bacterium SD302]
MSKKDKQEIPDQEEQSLNEEAAAEQEQATEAGATEETVDSDVSGSDALINEMNDRYLRLFAEFENYKKRTMRERLQLMETAGSKTMKALMPVLDDFDRARKAAESDEAKLAEYESGVGLIVKKMYTALKGLGLEPMESTGADFDADKHEAITEIPSPDMAGKVVDTVEKGYILNGNIIRYAKVVVGK